MSTVSNLLRRLWSHRPVITTAQRLDDLANGRFTDGALWAWQFRAEQGAGRPSPRRTTPTGKTLAAVRS